LAVYHDKDSAKDMSYADIVAAIGFLEKSLGAAGIAGTFQPLNHWMPPAPPAQPPVAPPKRRNLKIRDKPQLGP
jgi:hypothetical protein